MTTPEKKTLNILSRQHSEDDNIFTLEDKVLLFEDLFSPRSMDNLDQMRRFVIFHAAPDVGSFNDEEIDIDKEKHSVTPRSSL